MTGNMDHGICVMLSRRCVPVSFVKTTTVSKVRFKGLGDGIKNDSTSSRTLRTKVLEYNPLSEIDDSSRSMVRHWGKSDELHFLLQHKFSTANRGSKYSSLLTLGED